MWREINRCNCRSGQSSHQMASKSVLSGLSWGFLSEKTHVFLFIWMLTAAFFFFYWQNICWLMTSVPVSLLCLPQDDGIDCFYPRLCIRCLPHEQTVKREKDKNQTGWDKVQQTQNKSGSNAWCRILIWNVTISYWRIIYRDTNTSHVHLYSPMLFSSSASLIDQ